MDRRWLYLGLAVAAGVGLVRVLKPRVKPGETRIMLIGDSLAIGLGPYLKRLADEQRNPIDVFAISGSRIDQWADKQALTDRLERFNPNLVLISLGTNDEYLKGDVVERQRSALQRLLARIDQYPRRDDYGLGPSDGIAWVGPPSLPRSVGIVEMIQGEVRDYFDSRRFKIPRGPDGLHPTARGYAGWAGALWQWLH
jgi:lysophospholipase L1-like esterase